MARENKAGVTMRKESQAEQNHRIINLADEPLVVECAEVLVAQPCLACLLDLLVYHLN